MSFQGSSTGVAPLTSRDIQLADIGAAYVAVNPTPGTGIASGSAITALVETTPLLVLYNGGSLNIYPEYIRLRVTTANSGEAGLNYTFSVDNGNRYSSGGTALTINGTNPGSTAKSSAAINFGAITATAKSALQRNLGNELPLPRLEIAKDMVEFQFGSEGAAVSSAAAATASYVTVVLPAVVIPAGWSFLVNAWAAAAAGTTTYEVSIGYAEK